MIRPILFTLGLLLISTPAAALVNGSAPASDDTRFDAVAAFSKTSWLNDDAVDKTAHNWFGCGVLIAPDVVLIAKHLLPAGIQKSGGPGNYTLRFRRNTDGGIGSRKDGPGSYHQVEVARWVFASRADLALGILKAPVKHIKPVKVLLDPDESMLNRKCILAGWGSQSPWRGVAVPRTELRIGENKVMVAGNIIRILQVNLEMRENDKGERKPYVTSEEAVPNMHDSGGSIFVMDEEGQPILAGIIATYSGGSYLPGVAASTDFPLEAATQGGRALIDAIEKK